MNIETEPKAVRAEPKTGDIVVSVSGDNSTVWIQKAVGDGTFEKLGYSMTWNRQRFFVPCGSAPPEAVKRDGTAPELTPRKVLRKEWAGYAIGKTLPEHDGATIWRRYGYEWQNLGQVKSNATPPKNKRSGSGQAKRRTFAKGAILYTSWGYDQTNVEFYRITRRTPCSVQLEEIGCQTVPGSEGFMCCRVIPDPQKVVGQVKGLRRVYVHDDKERSLQISDCQTAWLWEGGEQYNSWYA